MFSPVLAKHSKKFSIEAALVEKIGAEDMTLTMVNTDQVYSPKLVVRMGAYGEHECTSVTSTKGTVKVGGWDFAVELAPGAGETLTITMKRFAHPPTVALPW